MAAILSNLRNTVIAGFVLALIVFLIYLSFQQWTPNWEAILPFFLRWIHIISGVMWIGLLYYFNFVNAAAAKAAAADGTGAGISKHVMPRALFWFRWAAVVTWLAGASLLGSNLGAAFMLQKSHMAIGIGAWLGTIMLINVWALIWPNQKKILGIVQASDEEKNKARRIAFLASRTNTMLSVPMLFFMAAGGHTALYFG
jgi:uncharacterized membrane protein